MTPGSTATLYSNFPGPLYNFSVTAIPSHTPQVTAVFDTSGGINPTIESLLGSSAVSLIQSNNWEMTFKHEVTNTSQNGRLVNFPSLVLSSYGSNPNHIGGVHTPHNGVNIGQHANYFGTVNRIYSVRIMSFNGVTYYYVDGDLKMWGPADYSDVGGSSMLVGDVNLGHHIMYDLEVKKKPTSAFNMSEGYRYVKALTQLAPLVADVQSRNTGLTFNSTPSIIRRDWTLQYDSGSGNAGFKIATANEVTGDGFTAFIVVKPVLISGVYNVQFDIYHGGTHFEPLYIQNTNGQIGFRGAGGYDSSYFHQENDTGKYYILFIRYNRTSSIRTDIIDYGTGRDIVRGRDLVHNSSDPFAASSSFALGVKRYFHLKDFGIVPRYLSDQELTDQLPYIYT
jgi:hypothetical protein